RWHRSVETHRGAPVRPGDARHQYARPQRAAGARGSAARTGRLASSDAVGAWTRTRQSRGARSRCRRLPHQTVRRCGAARTWQAVWGGQYGEESDYVWTFVQRIRRKIEPDHAHPRYVLTQAGVGYSMPVPDEVASTA